MNSKGKKKNEVIEFICGICIVDLVHHTILTPGQSSTVMWPKCKDLRLGKSASGVGSQGATDYFRDKIFIHRV